MGTTLPDKIAHTHDRTSLTFTESNTGTAASHNEIDSRMCINFYARELA